MRSNSDPSIMVGQRGREVEPRELENLKERKQQLRQGFIANSDLSILVEGSSAPAVHEGSRVRHGIAYSLSSDRFRNGILTK